MRIVLDTNVFVSGLLLPRSIPGRILEAWRGAALALVTSEPLLEELEEVLFRTRIRRRITLEDEEIRNYLSLIRFFSEVVVPLRTVPRRIRDADDIVVLATFLAGEADYLITGDADLLELAGDYPVLTPAAFWEKAGG